MTHPRNGKVITNIIENIAKEFKINNKINSISFDNDSNNNVAIDLLGKLMLNGDLFHCKCSCHILNLIV